MGLFVEFDVVDDFGYIDMTEEYAIIPNYSEGCAVFAETFLKVALRLVPVDTGYLRSTLTAEGGDTYCYAETDCEYAQYPEFGTWCQPEQSYFRPALEQAILAAQPYWDQAQDEALMKEEILIEEEEDAEWAEALAEQQSAANGAAQAQAINAWSQGHEPQVMGGINFSSPAAAIGSIIGAFIASFVITSVQAMMGKDFSSSGKGGRGIAGNNAGVYIPEAIIT